MTTATEVELRRQAADGLRKLADLIECLTVPVPQTVRVQHTCDDMDVVHAFAAGHRLTARARDGDCWATLEVGRIADTYPVEFTVYAAEPGVTS